MAPGQANKLPRAGAVDLFGEMRSLAKFSYLHAWSVLGIALALVTLAAFISSDIFERVEPFDISDPGAEVERASAAYEEATGSSAEPGVVLLISARERDLGQASTVAASELRSIEGISRVRSPSSEPALVSRDRTMGLVVGYLGSGTSPVEVGGAVDRSFSGRRGVLAGGTAVAAHQVGKRSEDDTRRIELFAAPVLLLLLMLVFRTLVAAMLPLLVAAFAILMTLAVLRLLTEVTVIDLFSLQVVTGLGAGLAIDYSLFVLARYREEIARGAGYLCALRETLVTAGRTVTFSSLTVAAALAALVVFPQPFLRSTGIAGALTAIFAGLTALLVLPAMLAILGPSVESLSVRRDRARHSQGDARWASLARAVCRRPLPALVVGGVVMLAVASQAIGMNLTTPDARELPSSDSARVVADAAAEFPDLPPTNLFAVLPLGAAGLPELVAEIEGIKGVTAVSDPEPLGEQSTQILISADVDPLSPQGQDSVAKVRDLLPAGSLLGGRSAELADERSSVAEHAPAAIALVVLTNLLILATMTRSLLLPLLALVMNLLTVAASLGVMAAVFMSESAASLLGADVPAGIDISVPALTSAVIFGLSTDYGIFLLARIREARRQAASETEAIIAGVATTGGLITASALLFATALGAFVFSDLVIIKEVGLAIAVAVLLDATVVRGLLIPASLRLLGRSAWWRPGWPRAA